MLTFKCKHGLTKPLFLFSANLAYKAFHRIRSAGILSTWQNHQSPPWTTFSSWVAFSLISLYCISNCRCFSARLVAYRGDGGDESPGRHLERGRQKEKLVIVQQWKGDGGIWILRLTIKKDLKRSSEISVVVEIFSGGRHMRSPSIDHVYRPAVTLLFIWL